MDRLRRHITPHYLMVAGLVLIWLAVLAALPALLPTQFASWFAFIALLITPGYLLGDIITWKLDLDAVERVALALPLGMAVLAVPGTISLVMHLDIHQLAMGWAIASGFIILIWLFHETRIFRHRSRGLHRARRGESPDRRAVARGVHPDPYGWSGGPANCGSTDLRP